MCLVQPRLHFADFFALGVNDALFLCGPINGRSVVEASQFDLARDAQPAEAVNDFSRYPSRQKAEQSEHDQSAGDLAQRVDAGKALARRRWITPQHEATDHDAKEASVLAVYGHRPDGVINLEPALHPVVHLIHEYHAEGGNEHGLDRMVQVVAGRCGDDASQAGRIGPVRVAL